MNPRGLLPCRQYLYSRMPIVLVATRRFAMRCTATCRNHAVIEDEPCVFTAPNPSPGARGRQRMQPPPTPLQHSAAAASWPLDRPPARLGQASQVLPCPGLVFRSVQSLPLPFSRVPMAPEIELAVLVARYWSSQGPWKRSPREGCCSCHVRRAFRTEETAEAREASWQHGSTSFFPTVAEEVTAKEQ